MIRKNSGMGFADSSVQHRQAGSLTHGSDPTTIFRPSVYLARFFLLGFSATPIYSFIRPT